MKILLIFCFLFFNQILFAENWITFDKNNSGLKDNYIYDFTIDNNNIKWFCTDSAIMSFDGVVWKSYIPYEIVQTGDSIICISSALDSSGNLWFLYRGDNSNSNSGLIMFDGQNFKVYPYPEKFSKGYAWTMGIDKNNNKWISFIDYGLVVFNDTLWTVYNKDNSQILSNQISSITIDSENNIWIGSVDSGFSIYDKGVWKNYNTQNSKLPSNEINDIKVIGKNTAWIATKSGLVKFENNNITILTKDDMGLGTTDEISCIQIENNNLWVGMMYDYDSFLRYDGENWKIFHPLLSSGLDLRYPKKIEIDKYGNKWIGMYFDGVAVYNENGVVLGVDNRNNYIDNNINIFPNPFSDRTRIQYNLEQSSNVKLTVFNSLGQQVKVLVNEYQVMGRQEAVFNASELPSGAYYFILQANNKIQSGRLMVVK